MTTTADQKVQATFGTYPKRIYPKGQILIFANENPEHIYYLVRGKVRKYDVSYRGEEVVVNIFKPPAYFPMSWAVNRTPNHYFYKTEEESEVHVVPTDAALAFVSRNPDVLLDLLSRIYQGLEGLLGRVVHLMAGTAQSRLIYELIIECRRFGSTMPDGTYKLMVTESDVGARSGLARETVSREMQKLKNKGWISINAQAIYITDLDSMENALGSGV